VHRASGREIGPGWNTLRLESNRLPAGPNIQRRLFMRICRRAGERHDAIVFGERTQPARVRYMVR
jgi:hypothetical protein